MAAAGIALLLWIYRCAMPKSAAASLLLAGWFGVTTVLNGDPYLEYNLQFLYGVAVTFGLCFPLLLLAEKKEKILTAACLVYASLLTVVAGVCIYHCVSGATIRSPFSGDIIYTYFRIFVFGYHSNELGCALGSAFFCWLLLAFRSRRLFFKSASVLGAAIVYLAAAICVSRMVSVVVSLAVGVAVFLPMSRCRAFSGKTLNMALAIVIAAAVAFVSANAMLGRGVNILGMLQARVAGNEAAQQETPIVPDGEGMPAAEKEEQPFSPLLPREFDDRVATFTGRLDIWREALNHIRERPITLLIGNTDGHVARIPVSVGWGAVHMQNIWIEMLMLAGIPGLLLYAYLMCRAIYSAIRLFFSRNAELWERFFAVIVPMMLLTGIMEIYPGVAGNVMDMAAMLLVGGVIGVSRPRSGRQDAVHAGKAA
jgi:hypothetical protein